MRIRRRLGLSLVAGALLLAVAVGVWRDVINNPYGTGMIDWRPAPPPSCIKDPAPVPTPLDQEGRPLNYLHACGSRLFDSAGREVRITGLNWFGMETGTYAPHGLWSRNWKTILDQIERLGYNALRIPLSNEALVPGQRPQGINYQVNPDLEGMTSLEILDAIVQEAGNRGLKVVLDRHRPTSAGQSDLWYTEEIGEEQWVSDWVMLAARYAHDDTVVGVDLHNEPKGAATWGTNDPSTDWRLAAERAGNAILETNPYLLIIVEGIEQYQGDWYWWGGNLRGARDHPVRLNLPGRLVYSAHDYGPGVYRQGWFDAPEYPRNLPRVWRDHWGYLIDEGIAPVLLGEFGGRSVEHDDEGVWQRSLLEYLKGHGVSYFAWSLNPNSGDTGGLLQDDWLSVDSEKQKLYRSYLAPPIVEPQKPRQAAPPSNMEVLYQAREASTRTNNIALGLQLVDRSGQDRDLSKVELRYWFSHGLPRGEPVVELDYAALGDRRVKAEIVKADRGGQDHYLRVTFPGPENPLPAYGSTGDILLRIHSVDWSQYDQTNDFSFQPEATSPRPSDRIAVYVEGNLVWGTEP